MSDSHRPPTSAARRSSPSVRDRVLHVRIDRPERAAMPSPQDMYRAIKRAAIWADREAGVDAVCLTGTRRVVRCRR